MTSHFAKGVRDRISGFYEGVQIIGSDTDKRDEARKRIRMLIEN
jgi:hypothetical protein